MRHRKVISLFESDPSHAELLDYLESIEGRNRQAQALLQMLMIGARVVLRQEGGEEAWYGVRNPDLRTVRREAKARLKPIPVSQVPALDAPARPPVAAETQENTQKPLREKDDKPSHDASQPTIESVLQPGGTYEVAMSAVQSPNTPVHDDDDDIMDPLQRLQMMREE
jgi:hypothetical protein